MKKVIYILFFLIITTWLNSNAQCYKCSKIVVSGPKIIDINQSAVYTANVVNCNYSNPASKLKWDYGDGTAITSLTNHTFAKPGVYTVKCFVENTQQNCNESYGTFKTIVTGCTECEGFDFYFLNNACINEKVTFVKYLKNCGKYSTSEIASNVRWDYGDGASITSDSTHKYSAAGTYTVAMITDKCIVVKNITISGCTSTFGCEPPADMSCYQLQLALGSSIISFDSNPSTGKAKYKLNLSYGLATDYTYTWNIKAPVPAGVSIDGPNTNQTVTIIKPVGTQGEVVLEVQICSVTIVGCCVYIENKPCADFDPQIEVVSQTHFDGNSDPIPGATNCTMNLKVKQPIIGGSIGATYTYLWSTTLGTINPNNTVGPVLLTAPNKKFAEINVIVTEQNKNLCSKNKKIFHYLPN